MSVPVSVFVPKTHRAWSSRELLAAVRANGFNLEFILFDSKKHSGSVPCKYQNGDAYFELYRNSLGEYLELVEEMREDDPDHFPYSDADLSRIESHDHVVQLITHSSFRGRVSAVIAAANLASMTNGWVLDEPVWEWRSGSESLAWARQIESEMANDVASERV